MPSRAASSFCHLIMLASVTASDVPPDSLIALSVWRKRGGLPTAIPPAIVDAPGVQSVPSERGCKRHHGFSLDGVQLRHVSDDTLRSISSL